MLRYILPQGAILRPVSLSDRRWSIIVEITLWLCSAAVDAQEVMTFRTNDIIVWLMVVDAHAVVVSWSASPGPSCR